MNTRILAMAAALLVPTALRAVDVEMKIDVAGAERTVVIRLDEKIAPETSANFAKLCAEGFYDGIGFHRVIPNYIVQTGDPLSKDPAQIEKWGTGGPGYTIPAELGGSHVRGAIAAARLGDQANPEKASSGSQFYVALRDIKPLDGKYTVFGNVISGLEAFDEIAGAPSNDDQVPTAPIAIVSTRILETKPAQPDLTATEPMKPAAPAASAVAAVEGTPIAAKPEKPAPVAAEPAKKDAPAVARPLAAAEPKPVAAAEPKPVTIAPPTIPVSAAEPAMVQTPAFTPLSLNDAPGNAPAASPEPSVADALATAMRGTPAPDPGDLSRLASGSTTGFAFGEPAPAPAAAPTSEEERMPLNPDRGLPPVRLTADDDTLAKATAAFGTPGGAGATAPDDGFMPLASVGNAGTQPAPASRLQERFPDPPRTEEEADPLAAPGFNPSPAAPAPVSRLQQRFPDASRPEPAGDPPAAPGAASFATAPETAGVPAEADPLATAPADGFAAPGEVPAPAPTVRKAEPEPPRGPLGRFIRRVW